MRKKVNTLTITLLATIVFFMISTSIQKQLIHDEPTVKCLVLKQDVLANEPVTEDMFMTADIPSSLLMRTKYLSSLEEITSLYAKENLYQGQIAVAQQFDTGENLSIFETESGKEKIAIKIQSAEYGASYAIRQNTFVNVYATLRSDYAHDFLLENNRLTIGDEYDGYTVIQLLNACKVLGTFNMDGVEVKETADGVIDSILLAVTPEEAKQINLLRDIASFNVTGVSQEVKHEDILD